MSVFQSNKQDDRRSDTGKFVHFPALMCKVFDFENDCGRLFDNFPAAYDNGVEDALKAFHLAAALDQNGP